jgi:ABC-type Fe3+-siderophore transport system permease subunit
MRLARPATAARVVRVLAVTALVLGAAFAASLALGGEHVDVLAALRGEAPDTQRFILRELRLPRTVAAALVGGALATAGVVFQALLRNPLAEPYLLGLSGGGSFGAVVSIVAFGAGTFASAGSRVIAAFCGCLLAIAFVYAVASRGGGLRPATLLLAGVVVNAFFLAALAAAQYVASPTEAQAILRWVMGGLSVPRPGELVLLGVAVPLAGAVVYGRAQQLNLLAFDEETAQHLGVDVVALRRLLFVTVSLLTAVCVAVSGPIGFVGLFVPHAVRALVGTDHRVLLPAAWGAGAAFLALADALARTVLAPQEIPVGIVTAVVGAPAVVLLLAARRPLRERAA